jgi:hypothetical protein
VASGDPYPHNCIGFGRSNMTFFAKIMLVLFIAGWFVAAGAWIYGTRFFLPMWITGFRKKQELAGYGRRAIKGYAIFVGAIIFCFAVGGLAELAGGWG